ncbi:MAG: OsmC family protein [Clostridia bacterium]|nr:OsmC family protein [Clostridia bacterium]
MSDELYVDLKLVNEKVKFTAVSNQRQDQGITMDYVPPLGDGEGFLGLEVLLFSFAGCVSTGITALLRRMGSRITRYEMRAYGIRKMNPLSLEKIHAVITLNADGVKEEDVRKSIALAESISPVWIAIKNNVEVSIDYILQ